MSSLPRGYRTTERYVGWLQRHSVAVALMCTLLMAVASWLVIFHLPLRADFADLLPEDAPSVRDLRRIEERVAAQDTVLVVVQAADPVVRARVASELVAAAGRLVGTLVARVEHDDAETRAFLRAHRHLFVPLADLEAARDALARRIKDARLKANPLYVDLEDEGDDAAADRTRLRELEDRQREARARLDRSSYVSEDQRTQLIVVRTAFLKTEVARVRELMSRLDAARDAALALPGRAKVQIGFAGGVPQSLAEHDALISGMVRSSVVTGLLVALVLAFYFRSATLLMLLCAALLFGVTLGFGVAALTVGHLNAATAFLGAIIAGNGVNYGILLIARYLEERRAQDAERAMVAAIHGTMRPTIVASLGAAIAYGSLAATSFRGFADFAIIGATGMILCWLAAFVLLPVLVLWWGKNTRMPRGEPVVGRFLARFLGFRRPWLVCVVTLAIAAACGLVSWRYIAEDPFEYDITRLRSSGADAREARRWLAVSDAEFGRGISGATYIAADRAEDVPLIVEALGRIDADRPPADRVIGKISWIGDVVPPDQEAKKKVLGQIRALLDDHALAALPESEQKTLEELRPPDHIELITPAHLPAEIADRLAERDGRIGLLIAVRPARSEWDGKALVQFAEAVRELRLDTGKVVTTSGASVIFADILGAVQADGPFVTGLAALALVIMVLVVVGRNLRSVAVLVATALGALGLVAACALLGLKVNFLDFVALPITLGLGVDYAVNIAHRHRHEVSGPGRKFLHDADRDDMSLGAEAIATLRTSGSAVFVCSLTTIIGYGSLLVSDNLAIRSFGLAALIGELSCLVTALVVVPALLSLKQPRPLESRHRVRAAS